MDERDIKRLLHRLEGPTPRPETTRAIMDAARRATTPSTDRRKPGSRPLRWAVAASILLCVTAGIWLTAAREVLATVASDTLPVRRNDKITLLGRQAPLYAGDEIAATATSDIILNGRSKVRIDAGALLRLHPPRSGERARLALRKGRIFLRVSQAQGAFIVAATAEVSVLGTNFGVEEQNGLTSVHVLSGSVALRSGGQELTLDRGRSGKARNRGVPVETTTDPNFALLWARDATLLENRPLGEVLDWLAANSSYRFQTPAHLRTSVKVTVAIGDEPVPEVLTALMLTCNLRHNIEGYNVQIRE